MSRRLVKMRRFIGKTEGGTKENLLSRHSHSFIYLEKGVKRNNKMKEEKAHRLAHRLHNPIVRH